MLYAWTANIVCMFRISCVRGWRQWRGWRCSHIFIPGIIAHVQPTLEFTFPCCGQKQYKQTDFSVKVYYCAQHGELEEPMSWRVENKYKFCGLLILYGLTLILAWTDNHMPSKVWVEITYPFPNFNDSTVEVWEWISNFIQHFIMHVIYIHVGIAINPY